VCGVSSGMRALCVVCAVEVRGLCVLCAVECVHCVWCREMRALCAIGGYTHRRANVDVQDGGSALVGTQRASEAVVCAQTAG
jgi:hypothetical protein